MSIRLQGTRVEQKTHREVPEPEISVRHLADFMAASERARRTSIGPSPGWCSTRRPRSQFQGQFKRANSTSKPLRTKQISFVTSLLMTTSRHSQMRSMPTTSKNSARWSLVLNCRMLRCCPAKFSLRSKLIVSRCVFRPTFYCGGSTELTDNAKAPSCFGTQREKRSHQQ